MGAAGVLCTVYTADSGGAVSLDLESGVRSIESPLLSLNFQSKIAKITSKDYIVGYIGK